MKRYPKTPYSMSHLVKTRDNEYNGRYRGTVLDNEDPLERGRCKVFVYGVYDSTFKSDAGARLPWAEPCIPLFCGGSGEFGDNGMFNPPDVGSTVWVSFESGDITKPVMDGITSDKNGKFNVMKAKIHWEGMDIEFDKLMHTITVSGDNVVVNCNRSEINADETFVNTQSAALSAGVVTVKSSSLEIDSSKIDIKTKNMEVSGGFGTTSGVNGSINGSSIATVKNGIVVAIT